MDGYILLYLQRSTISTVYFIWCGLSSSYAALSAQLVVRTSAVKKLRISVGVSRRGQAAGDGGIRSRRHAFFPCWNVARNEQSERVMKSPDVTRAPAI